MAANCSTSSTLNAATEEKPVDSGQSQGKPELAKLTSCLSALPIVTGSITDSHPPNKECSCKFLNRQELSS